MLSNTSIQKRSHRAPDNYKCKIRFGLTVAFASPFLPSLLVLLPDNCFVFAPFITKIYLHCGSQTTEPWLFVHASYLSRQIRITFSFFKKSHVRQLRLIAVSRLPFICDLWVWGIGTYFTESTRTRCVVNWTSLWLKLKFIIIIGACGAYRHLKHRTIISGHAVCYEVQCHLFPTTRGKNITWNVVHQARAFHWHGSLTQ